MAFKKVKTISTGLRLYYNSSTGDYEVRSQKSNLKRYVEGRGETVVFKNGIFQPGQSLDADGNPTLTQDEIDKIQKNIYDIRKRIGSTATATLPPDYKQTEADAFEAARKWKASQTNTSPGQGDVYDNSKVKLGSSDSLLKSFGPMKYPIDADYGNTQDYVIITQYTYSPVRKKLFSGAVDSEGKPKAKIFSNITSGVARDNPKKDLINMVKLPIPNGLADSNNVSWGKDTMNALAAAAAGAVSQVVNKDNVEGLMKNPLQTIGKELGETAGQIAGGIGGMGKAFQDIAKNDSMTNLAAATLGSSALNMLGVGMSAEDILARGQGIVPNSNLEKLFNGPSLRTFQFSWKMSPRSKEEALVINKIIRSFKQGMAAKKINPTSGTGASFFLGTPNVFDIHFKTHGGEFIDGLFRIKTSACTATSVAYTDGSQWSAYDDGQPTSITLQLSFEELEPVYDSDYSETPLGAGLDPIPDTSIGY